MTHNSIRFEGRSLIDSDQLAAWIATSNPGESIVYHNGFLSRDRQRILNDAEGAVIDKIRRVAEMAWMFAGIGQVSLVQRRIGELMYDYIAIRRRSSGAVALNDLAGSRRAATA